jgi:hypothetical protein
VLLKISKSVSGAAGAEHAPALFSQFEARL